MILLSKHHAIIPQWTQPRWGCSIFFGEHTQGSPTSVAQPWALRRNPVGIEMQIPPTSTRLCPKAKGCPQGYPWERAPQKNPHQPQRGCVPQSRVVTEHRTLVALPSVEKIRRFLEADREHLESMMPAPAARKRTPRKPSI